MQDFTEDIFKCKIFNKNFIKVTHISLEFFFRWPTLLYISIDSSNDYVISRWQAIVWTNDEKIHITRPQWVNSFLPWTKIDGIIQDNTFNTLMK